MVFLFFSLLAVLGYAFAAKKWGCVYTQPQGIERDFLCGSLRLGGGEGYQLVVGIGTNVGSGYDLGACLGGGGKRARKGAIVINGNG